MAPFPLLALRDPRQQIRNPSTLDSPTPNQRVLTSVEDISSARLRRLFEHWSLLKGDRYGPARSELNPGEMREQLGWIWLMDVIDGGYDFRFRMGGDRVIQFFGQRLAGAMLRNTIPLAPQFFGRFFDLATLALASRHPVIGGPGRTTYQPKSYLEVEAVLFPLSDDGREITGLLGSIETRPLPPTLS